MFDIKIINGFIIDGSGKEGYKGDIGIVADKIVKIGDLSGEEAIKKIDAKGNVVSPGFIDMHTHSDMSLVYDRRASSRIYSGITTDVIGNCGIGIAPVKEENRQLLLDYLGTRIVGSMPVELELPWDTYESYIKYMEENPPAVNVAPLLAQGPIRIFEMGFSKEHPSEDELQNMIDETEKCMQMGARGITSGLVYLPGEYTTRNELVKLCKVVAKYGGFYATHIRNEGDDVLESVDEAISVAKEANIHLHISHLKALGWRNYGKSKDLLEKIKLAQEEGLEVSFDVYPYIEGMTSLSALMPPWTFEGGVDQMLERIKIDENREKIKRDIIEGIPGWQNFAGSCKSWNDITIVSVTKEEDAWMEGKTITEIAKETNRDEFTTVFETLINENGRVQITPNMMDPEDVDRIICHPESMIGSDSMSLATEGLLAKTSTHPRAFGTHTRILSHYVRDKKLISLEDGVKKLTSLPAKILGLNDRGILAEGNYADIVIFDKETIKDMATYANPKQYPQGIECVLVNGKVALEEGKQVDILNGKILVKSGIPTDIEEKVNVCVNN